MSSVVAPVLSDDVTVKNELWFRGQLRYITWDGPQREIYDFIRNRDTARSSFSPYVLNLHRRLGKTFLGLLLAVEECIRNPGIRAKFIAPSLTQAQDILREHFSTIMLQCPPELEPSSHRNETFTFRNPRWGAKNKYVFSTLRLYGVKDDRGNKARGTSTDIAIMDECREFSDLRFTWTSVLLPTFKHSKEPLAIMVSTPPESMDHPFSHDFIPQAITRKRYICVPGSEDPGWTKEDDEMHATEMGGRDSPAYRREIECELISDQSKLIIPEFVFHDKRQKSGKMANPLLVDDWQRPSHYLGYAVADFGGSLDYTGILTGFVDFAEKKLIAEYEYFGRDINTEGLVKIWRELERVTFDKGQCTDLRRYADSGQQRLNDMHRIWDLTIAKAPKHDAYANRSILRTLINLGRVRINKRCEQLIYQLRNGSIDKRGVFARSDSLGHCDLVAALVYLARLADFDANPFPKQAYSREDHWVPPEGPRSSGWDMFFGKRGRR